MDNCPKCGAKKVKRQSPAWNGPQPTHTCGSVMFGVTQQIQTDKCRITELEKEVDRLKAENARRCVEIAVLTNGPNALKEVSDG